jgi:hypothetical protein
LKVLALLGIRAQTLSLPPGLVAVIGDENAGRAPANPQMDGAAYARTSPFQSTPSRDSFSHERVAGLMRATSTKTSSIEMAIYRLLRNSTMQPEEASRITEAYEQALHTLCVKDRDDRLTEIIAKTIIKIAQTGVHDPAQLSALAIKQLGVR